MSTTVVGPEPITARELDRLVCVEVLGWTRKPVTFTVRGSRGRMEERQQEVWVDAAGNVYNDVRHVSSSLTAAERVLWHMSAEGYLWRFSESLTGWTAWATLPDAAHRAEAPTLAQAICLAALAAKGINVAGVTAVGAA